MTENIIQRLTRLGYTTKDDLEIWEHHWNDMDRNIFFMLLNHQDEAAFEYKRWYPRLQRYAAKCRWNAPILLVDEKFDEQREQHRILLAKMVEHLESNDCLVSPRPLHHNVTILTTPDNGLAAAEQLFGRHHVIILTESEWSDWYENVHGDEHDLYSWCNRVWFSLQSKFEEGELEYAYSHYPIAEGCDYWVIESGLAWGSLAGGAEQELWCWNGSIATFLTDWTRITF